ncbi:unnamed protein product [Ectocarpus sp. CCAP 1310/34]|nr:unnamed protein product [Ectocarpus sp. CCAP 1310/34]
MELGDSIATPLPPPTATDGRGGKPALQHYPHPSDAAATAGVGVQRCEWGQTTQQVQGERQQQSQEFPPAVLAVLALQLQEWGETQQQQPLQEASPTLRRRQWGRCASAATHSLGGGCLRDDQEAGHDQPPFVMMGMLDDSRALMLPTTRERREVMQSLSSASVPVTWTDSTGQSRTAILTRTEARPKPCNPFPMLANLLAWMRELPPGALPENRLRVRLETLLAPQSPSNNKNNNNNNSTHDGRASGGGDGDGDLSRGAAWLLAHLMLTGPFEREIPNGKAMSEGGGSLCTYSVEVAAFETHTGICDKAADELVHAGFARKVEFGEMLALDQKTGPMASGLCPPDIPSLFSGRQTWRSSTKAVRGGDKRSSCRGRMGGLVGDLGLRVLLLLQVLKGETAGDLTSRREWTGPMAQAFGLLGGAEATYHKRRRDSIGGTVSADWVASLWKEERLLEVACLRLKQAMKWVSNLSKPSVLVVVRGLAEGSHKDGEHDEAVLTFRLLVRRDQAYTRLATNLKTHLKRPREEQLDVVKAACDDDCVRGGDRVDLWERYQSLHKQFGGCTGTQQTASLKRQQRSPLWDPKVEDIHPPVETQKQGSQGILGEKGGRKLYYYIDGTVPVLGWDCTEEVFDSGVEAAVPHCILISPLDMSDKFFTTRREGLPGRLAMIRQYADRQLFSDVGQRYDRWAFGDHSLIVAKIPHAFYCCGGTAQIELGDGRDWNATTHFGLGWQGHGQVWEVEVVEVKSKGDTIRKEQKAWLAELEDIGVPAMVSRVVAENEAVPKKRSRSQ